MAIQVVSSNSSSSSSTKGPTRNLMPVYGSISIQGVSPNMNDRWFVEEDFCQPIIFSGMPLHFFAMHVIVAKELMHVEHWESMTSGAFGGDSDSSSIAQQQVTNEKIGEDKIQRALRNSFERMDFALGACSCDGASHMCRCRPMVHNFSGSTANVVILSLHHIIVANCGNSRVVLCRAGKAIPLSNDHKPNRPDELERIYAVGGKLVNRDGLMVNGILDTTRALGDYLLKGIIISEPKINITKRKFEDELLILASDGLWNVCSDAQACAVVNSCLTNEGVALALGDHNPGHLVIDEMEAMIPTKSAYAASILSQLALARGNEDNISVIVIDLLQC